MLKSRIFYLNWEKIFYVMQLNHLTDIQSFSVTVTVCPQTRQFANHRMRKIFSSGRLICAFNSMKTPSQSNKSSKNSPFTLAHFDIHLNEVNHNVINLYFQNCLHSTSIACKEKNLFGQISLTLTLIFLHFLKS